MTLPPLSITRRLLLTAAVLLTGLSALRPHPALAEAPPATGWVIEADAARVLLAEGAILLDTRSPDLRAARPVEGAIAVQWQEFTNPDLPNKGLLLTDDAVLTEKLRGLGISKGVPVLVIADPAKGWGEDGRIVWTLRTLGQTESYLVNGGVEALLAAGPPVVRPVLVPGDFTVARTEAYDIGRDELAGLVGKPDVVILDTREAREFAGETPYGETRGGHVPGARHIFFKDLVGPDGRIVGGEALKARLAALGVTEGTQVVSYCTGGIRSGFVTAVLNDAGIKARNYAGSMWEWSSGDAATYPLVTE